MARRERERHAARTSGHTLLNAASKHAVLCGEEDDGDDYVEAARGKQFCVRFFFFVCVGLHV